MRERIRRAAFQQFAEKGYGNVSIDTLAKDLGLHKANIFYHFSNREGLAVEVIAYAEDLLLEEVKARSGEYSCWCTLVAESANARNWFRLIAPTEHLPPLAAARARASFARIMEVYGKGPAKALVVCENGAQRQQEMASLIGMSVLNGQLFSDQTDEGT